MTNFLKQQVYYYISFLEYMNDDNNFVLFLGETDKVEALKSVLQSIPRTNYIIIHYLMKFLKEISTHSEINKMAASNLGIVFGPTLMRNKEESLSGMMNPMNNPAGTISALIENFESIFGEDPEELTSTTTEIESNTETKPLANAPQIKKPPMASPSESLITRNRRGSSPVKAKANENDNRPPRPSQPGAGRRLSRSQTVNQQNEPTSGNAALASIIAQQSKKPERTQSKPEAVAKPPIMAPKPSIPPKPAIQQEKPFIPPKPTIPPKPSLDTMEENPPPIPQKPSLPAKPEPAKIIATALYDYAGNSEMDQISFNAGDKIEVLQKHQSGWWTGNLNGTTGLFPVNFVQVDGEVDEY